MYNKTVILYNTLAQLETSNMKVTRGSSHCNINPGVFFYNYPFVTEQNIVAILEIIEELSTNKVSAFLLHSSSSN